ncbi:hypothetical protein RIVM261_062980 [Rivularia sp. IAM M-261]|nr:hypothetical protein RIVM261_062980 [Rivularia sp. IAM M-261]
MSPDHARIIICTEDTNFARLAARIHEAISIEEDLTGFPYSCRPSFYINDKDARKEQPHPAKAKNKTNRGLEY